MHSLKKIWCNKWI